MSAEHKPKCRISRSNSEQKFDKNISKKIVTDMLSALLKSFPSVTLHVDSIDGDFNALEFTYRNNELFWRTPTKRTVPIHQSPGGVSEILYLAFNLPMNKHIKIHTSLFPEYDLAEIKLRF